MKIKCLKSGLLLLVAVAMLVAMSSCDKTDEQVNDFLTQLQAAQQSGDIDRIAQLYPAAAEADSLVINFNPETIKTTHANGDTLIVTLGEGIDLALVKGENGALQGVSSHGLFAYPADQLQFAQKTGQFNASLNDVENAQRMGDTLFVKYLTSKISENVIVDLKAKVTIVKSVCYKYDWDNFKGLCTVVISNQSSRQIEGNEYEVKADLYDISGDAAFGGSRVYCGSRKLTGKPIPANNQVSYSFSYNVGGYPLDPVSTISIHPNLMNLLSDYQPTGHEYEEYLKNK